MNLSEDRKITEIMKENTFTLSTEIVPPRNGTPPSVIFEQIQTLVTAGSNFIAVTKGAGGSLRAGSLPIAQTIKEKFHTPCIAHFTSRDLLPEEVENLLVDHHFFGIRNILALRGDPPQGVHDWQPREGSYPFAYQLVSQIKELNDGAYLDRKGFQMEGREKTDFCIGVACYPDHPHLQERIDFFKRKVEAGADFAISQMLFDSDSYERFLNDSGKAGCEIPILPGTRLLKSRSQAHKMSQRFGIPIAKWLLELLPETDAEANQDLTINAFLRLNERLKSAGAPGIHIFVLSDTELASIALRSLRTAP